MNNNFGIIFYILLLPQQQVPHLQVGKQKERLILCLNIYNLISNVVALIIIIKLVNLHIITTATCENTDGGATDPWGDDCDDYARNKHWCGLYDDSDFDSNSMCCACGGGNSGGKII